MAQLRHAIRRVAFADPVRRVCILEHATRTTGVVTRIEERLDVKSSERVTVGEVADKLGVHRVTVWRWIREGKLSGVRVGEGVWRIDPADIDSLVTVSTATAVAR